MTLQTNLQSLATEIATAVKGVKTLVNGNAADVSALNTAAKNNLVAAINELHASIATLASGSAGINDSATGNTNTWSATKISAEILTARNALLNGAPGALDTLLELSNAIASDPNFANTMALALGNRVRVDGAQALSTGQKLQACQNIGIGDPETNFVSTFQAGLV
mgnify:CR=1 FL=1